MSLSACVYCFLLGTCQPRAPLEGPFVDLFMSYMLIYFVRAFVAMVTKMASNFLSHKRLLNCFARGVKMLEVNL